MVPALTDDEMDFIEAILDKYSLEDSFYCFNQVDGMITALVSGPDELEAESWVPRILNEYGEEIEWDSEEEKLRFYDLLIQHYNYRILVFMNQTEEFDAVVYIDEDGEDEREIWNEWAEGYLRGMALQESWTALPSSFKNFTKALQVFGVDELDPEVKKLNFDAYVELSEEMIPGIHKVHQYWKSK